VKEKAQRIIPRFWGYIRRYKWRIVISMIASLGVAGTDVAYVKLIQPMVDIVLAPGGQRWIYWVPVVVIGLAVIKGFSRYIQEYFIRTGGQLVVQDIRNDVFRHSVDLSMGYFSRNTTGNLISRILNDIGVMQRAASSVLVETLREGATLLGLTALAFYQDWKLASMAFVVLPIAGFPAARIGSKIKSYSRRQQGAMGSLTKVLEQAFSGIKVIKAFGTEKDEFHKFKSENRSFYHFFRKVIKYDAASSPVVEILGSLGLAAVLWYGMDRVLSGAMTQGELFSIMAAILMMYTPAKRLTKINNRVQQAMGAAERVFELVDEPVQIHDMPGANVIGRAQGEIVFENVSFSYDVEPVLQDFSLHAAPGEIVALVGPSGAGKTTIAGLLNRFYDPDEGSILIDGHDIRNITQASLKKNLALVDQESFLFSDSIRTNIAYGSSDASIEAIEEAARLAYADDFIRMFPERYDTQIGDRGVRLSGGQRQRICIARAILRDAPILILDEATSALDSESEAMVQKALVNLMKNRTTLVIAHRLSTVMHADRILVMEKGRVAEAGNHRDLLGLGGLYRRLYDMQFQSRDEKKAQ